MGNIGIQKIPDNDTENTNDKNGSQSDQDCIYFVFNLSQTGKYHKIKQIKNRKKDQVRKKLVGKFELVFFYKNENNKIRIKNVYPEKQVNDKNLFSTHYKLILIELQIKTKKSFYKEFLVKNLSNASCSRLCFGIYRHKFDLEKKLTSTNYSGNVYQPELN